MGGGCSSLVGYNIGDHVGEKAQPLSLDHGCRSKFIVTHELGHALGFWHEQNRRDRDQYIRVYTENTEAGGEHNSEMNQDSLVDTEYDFLSIMHYDQWDRSWNEKVSMVTLDPRWQELMGTATVLSFADVKAANEMYTCDAQCADRSACPRGGYRDKHCVCMCEGEPLAEDGRTTVPCSENFHSDKLAHMLRDSWRNVPECKNWWHDVHCEPLEQQGLCTDPYKGKWMRDHCMKTCGCCY